MAAPRRPRPRAVVLAEHGEPPVHLGADERALLEEALRRGEDLREQVESQVTSYGRWLLATVFANDAAPRSTTRPTTGSGASSSAARGVPPSA